MHQVSEAFQRILQTDYTAEFRLMVNDYFAVWKDKLISLSAKYRAMGDEAPGVGYACAATLDAEMLYPDDDIPNGAKITLQCRIRNSSEASEWINKGVFWVDRRDIRRDANGTPVTMQIEAYDSMVKCEFEIDVTGWTAKTDAQLLTEIMTKAGVSSAWVPDKGYTIDTAPDKMTGRDVIGFLAAMYGGNAAFDDNGQLRLIPLSLDPIGGA